MSDFLPHGGSHFDDIKVDEWRDQQRKRKQMGVPQTIEEELLPMFQNLRERPHATVYVKTPKVAEGINMLLQKWYQDHLLRTKNPVKLNPNLRFDQVVVE